MALLEVQHISKNFSGENIIQHISFCQQALQKIAIAGNSGAGKTTLLKIISGYLQPTAGNVFFNGQRVKRAGRNFTAWEQSNWLSFAAL